MYPYLSPTGGGMTPNKELAERMERLRLDYIRACKEKDEALKTKIRDDERQLLMLIGNENQKIRNAEDQRKERMPRVVRVVAYEDVGKRCHVYLDTHEIEMLQIPIEGARPRSVLMRSGRTFDVNDNDFNLLEKAIRERE